MILSAQSIRRYCQKERTEEAWRDLHLLGPQLVKAIHPQEPMIEPFVERTVDPQTGMSYGLSSCGYGIKPGWAPITGRISDRYCLPG